MDITSIVSTAELIMRVAKLAMQVGEDVKPHVISAYQVLVKKEPLTKDQREKLLADEKRLRDILQQPEED